MLSASLRLARWTEYGKIGQFSSAASSLERPRHEMVYLEVALNYWVKCPTQRAALSQSAVCESKVQEAASMNAAGKRDATSDATGKPAAGLAQVEVLCHGIATVDVTLGVAAHPEADTRMAAESLTLCGGGPASNASVAAVRLGCAAAFSGYLGHDLFGDLHLAELAAAGVNTELVFRDEVPTQLSVSLVKPNGDSSLVFYREDPEEPPIQPDQLDALSPRVMLFDGRFAGRAAVLADRARSRAIPTVLDAGLLSPDTERLAHRVDYVVASRRFAEDFAASPDSQRCLDALEAVCPAAVVTLGSAGLVWVRDGARGSMPAFAVEAVDTVGAGDAFHGGFCAGLRRGLAWPELLRYASATAALTCTRFGGRPGLPHAGEVERFLQRQR